MVEHSDNHARLSFFFWSCSLCEHSLSTKAVWGVTPDVSKAFRTSAQVSLTNEASLRACSGNQLGPLWYTFFTFHNHQSNTLSQFVPLPLPVKFAVAVHQYCTCHFSSILLPDRSIHPHNPRLCVFFYTTPQNLYAKIEWRVMKSDPGQTCNTFAAAITITSVNWPTELTQWTTQWI